MMWLLLGVLHAAGWFVAVKVMVHAFDARAEEALDFWFLLGILALFWPIMALALMALALPVWAFGWLVRTVAR